MENTENAVAEIEVDHKTNLLQFSEDKICEHYANLAMHIIAAFSNEFKSEECVKRLKTILKFLEEDKDEVLKCKAGNDNSEKGDIVEAECKETERVWRQNVKKLRGWRQDIKKLRGWRQNVKKLRGWRQYRRKLRGWRQNVKKLRVEAECKKEVETVEAESTESKRMEAECKKEAETVEAESTETETVEAARKTEELCKENEGKSKKSVSFPKSVECNMETVPEDNLDDTLELNETSEDSEQQV